MLGKEYYNSIQTHLKKVDFSKINCSEKGVEKLSADLQALCYLKKYIKDKNASLFLKNSEKLEIKNLATIDSSHIPMFSIHYYNFIADATLKAPKKGLTLLFNIMDHSDGFYATNVQSAISLLFLKSPKIIVNNIDLLRKLIDARKEISIDAEMCVDKKYSVLFSYVDKKDTKKLKDVEYVISRMCF
jgi:hypothetical protein